MKKFTSVNDVEDVNQLVLEALIEKKFPFANKELGKNKTLGLIFLNPSLRTRLSTQRAAQNLGMNVMVMNLDKEGWSIETKDGTIMDGSAAEHIKEAAAVIGQYCDIIGVRSFPKLHNREEDYSDEVLNKFIQYAGVPVISLESATLHPFQSLADLITITEIWNSRQSSVLSPQSRPKVVLTWAPHPKTLPQSVPNSFSQWMLKINFDFVITHPQEYELDETFTKGAKIIYNQDEALKGADFVYTKNWSSYKEYGKILSQDKNWMITNKKMSLTNNAKFMHCLPVRRNVVVADEVLDGKNSVVLLQAKKQDLFRASCFEKNVAVIVKKVFIIKIGGNVIDDEKQLSSFLNDFASSSEKKILVHGGGKIATELGKQLGIEPKMVDGRRITDADTLHVVQMVYGGLINKNIVAQLQSKNCNAIGLTGADGNIILSKKRAVKDIDYGFVGDIEKVNAETISTLLNSEFYPVIAPLTHDGKGQMLNTNADTMASAISVAMSKKIDTTLIYCFEKSGVLRNVDDESSVIEKINSKEYEKLKSQGIISKGMIPKLDNAFDAIKNGVEAVVICHAKDFKKVISGQKAGTTLM